jgi:hypothetical protein
MTVSQIFDKWDIFSLGVIKAITSILYDIFGMSNFFLARIFLFLFVCAFIGNAYTRWIAGNYIMLFLGLVFNSAVVIFTWKSISEAKGYSKRFYLNEDYRNARIRIFRIMIFFLIPISISVLAMDYWGYTVSNCKAEQYYKVLSQAGFMIASVLIGLAFMFISIRPPDQKRF